MSERSCITVFAAVVFAACGGGGGIEIPTGGPQGGVNIQVCATSGTTGSCAQGATNTNISGPAGGGGQRGPVEFPPMSDDESWLPRNLRGETFDPRVEQKFGYSNDYDSELNEDFPAWDDSLISVGNGQPGAESANDSALKEAAQDDLPGVLLWELYYRGRERADTGKAVYKRLTARGFIRLINKNNNDIDEFTGDPFDPGTLINRARTVCEIILGGAAEEIDNGNIDAAIDLAYDIGYATKTFQALHGEPLVTFVRAIDNVLVEKSMCRVALTRSGDVKRILVEWPQFKICEGIVTTSAPETVKAQVLERIAATGIEQRVAMAKKVVYRRYQSEAGACFFPALSVGVLPDPAEDLNDVFKAPFVVTVPLVP